MSVPKESSGFGAGFLAEELPIEAGAPEDGPIREEKIANAVQFLVHPKVQASSIEERRKFLDRKGLTSKEIDDAFRAAQPELDKLAAARPRAGAPARPPTMAPQAVPSEQQPSARPLRTTMPQTSAPQYSQAVIASGGDGGGWARAILASLAVVGLGSGLGLFVRKMLEAKQQEGRWDWGGSERAAAAAAKKRMDEEERERDRRQMQQLIDKLDAVQGTVNQVTRSIEQLSTRVEKLESRPSGAEIKADVMAGVNAAMAAQAMSDLKADIASLKTIMSASVIPGTPLPSTVGGHRSEPNTPAAPPPGLPNARVFRKLNTSAAAAGPPLGVGAETAPPPPNPPPGLVAVGDGNVPYSAGFNEVLQMVQKGGVPSDVEQIDDTPLRPGQEPAPPTARAKPKPWERNFSPVTEAPGTPPPSTPPPHQSAPAAAALQPQSGGAQASAAPNLAPLAQPRPQPPPPPLMPAPASEPGGGGGWGHGQGGAGGLDQQLHDVAQALGFSSPAEASRAAALPLPADPPPLPADPLPPSSLADLLRGAEARAGITPVPSPYAVSDPLGVGDAGRREGMTVAERMDMMGDADD